MELFFIILFCLVAYKTVKPAQHLNDFNSRNTLPLRGLLALFIIFHHVSLNFDMTFGIHFFEKYRQISPNLFWNMGVPVVGVFFFLTGYGLAKSLINKGNGYLDGFLKKRFKSTLPEFLVLTALVSVYLIIAGLPAGELASKMGHGYTPLPFSWFIYAITYVYIAFFISGLLCRGKIKSTGWVMCGFLACYIVVTAKILHWGNYWYISILSVPLGYFVSVYEKYADRILQNRLYLILLLVFSAILGGIGAMFDVGAIPAYALVILTYCALRLYTPSHYLWKRLGWLGDISLNIYLIHGLVILSLHHFYPKGNGAILLVLITILSIGSAYGLKKIRDTFIHKPEKSKVA